MEHAARRGAPRVDGDQYERGCRIVVAVCKPISRTRMIDPQICGDITIGDGHRRGRSHGSEWDRTTRELVLPNPQRRVNHIQISDKMMRPHHVCERCAAGFAELHWGDAVTN